MLIIGIFATALSTLSFSLAWLERRIERQRSYVFEQNKPPFSVLLKSFFTEAFLLFIAIVSSPLMLIKSQNKNTASSPIVLIHGYAHNRCAWFFIQKYLQMKGFGRIHTLNLFPPFGSIESLAKQVQNELESIKKDHEKAVLIGHSMGGLVAAYFAENLANEGEISQIITLGSPFLGTRLAAFGIGKNAAQMVPQSNFLISLNEKISKSPIPYYHLASKIDNIIVPWNSALPKKQEGQEFVVQDLGHLSLLASPLVAQKIIKWLLRHEKINDSKHAKLA